MRTSQRFVSSRGHAEQLQPTHIVDTRMPSSSLAPDASAGSGGRVSLRFSRGGSGRRVVVVEPLPLSYTAQPPSGRGVHCLSLAHASAAAMIGAALLD